MIMLFQIVQLDFIAACRDLTSCYISSNMAVDFFSKPNNLFICG